jgi:methylglyoxal reductase
LIQMHTYWPQWDDDAYWLEELHHLKREGKVRYIGVSLPDHRHDLGISLARSGLISSIQTIVNVFDSAALDSLVPVCQANGVAVLARVILDEGGLSGFLRAETEFAPKDYRSNYFDCVPRQVYLEKIDRLKSYIPEHAESLVELAIRFVLTHPGISAALTSMQVPEYAQQNIEAAVKPPISSELFEILKIRHRWLRNFYHERKHLQ